MLLFNKYRGWNIFRGADTGGGVGNPAASQGGQAPTENGDSSNDPFSVIDFDDLPPDIRANLEKAKAEFATLQTSLRSEKERVLRVENVARGYQSQADQAKAQLLRLTPQTPQDPRAAELSKYEKILISKGVSAENAKVQADIMVEMFGAHAEQIKQEIGRDLAPMAGSVLQREAEQSWEVATTQDKSGAFQIPEVAQKVWDNVQQMTQNGQSVNAATVVNLKRMFYAEHLEENP